MNYSVESDSAIFKDSFPVFFLSFRGRKSPAGCRANGSPGVGTTTSLPLHLLLCSKIKSSLGGL